jgi:tRNA A58 N-methylase Trm61
MYVDKRDKFVSQDIRKYGSYQGANSYLIGELVNPGNKVLNVGSQTGQEALVMAKVIGPTGKLFIFEPYWFSNYLVTSNINYNNFSDYTTIYKKGASD